MQPFFAEHASLSVGQAARAPAHTRVEPGERGVWTVAQVLCDVDDANDWVVEGVVDLERSREEGRPVVWLKRIGT